MLLSDADFLRLGLGLDALGGVPAPTREVHEGAASAWVLSYVVPRYDLATVLGLADPCLVEAAATRASYTLLSHRGVADRDPTWIVVRDRMTQTEEWLTKIRDGFVHLPGTAGPTKGTVAIVSAPVVWSGRASDRWGCR